jgi:hypothetical protein
MSKNGINDLEAAGGGGDGVGAAAAAGLEAARGGSSGLKAVVVVVHWKGVLYTDTLCPIFHACVVCHIFRVITY